MTDQQQIHDMLKVSWRWPLIAFGGAILPLVLAFAYYFFRVENPDPILLDVIATIHRDATAETVLGQNIVMAGLPTFSYCHDSEGKIARFTFSVRGNRAERAGQAVVFTPVGQTTSQIKSIVLTAPDRTTSDIAGSTADESWLAEAGRGDNSCRHIEAP